MNYKLPTILLSNCSKILSNQCFFHCIQRNCSWSVVSPKSEFVFNYLTTGSRDRFFSKAVGKSSPYVYHNTSDGRFCIDVDGFCAYLEYERENNVVKIMHTVVPEELSGQGYGNALAKAALEYVAKNNYQLEIQCEFIEHFVSNKARKYIKYLKE